TNCEDLADIAEVLQAAVPDTIVTTNGTTTITITSKTVGSTSAVTIAAYAGAGTDLSGASFFKTSTSVPAAGTNSSGESIVDALTRMDGQVGFVPFMTNMDLENSAVIAIAAAVQARDNMFFHHVASTSEIAGLA